MDRTDDLYYSKMMYRSAAKNLLTENYLFSFNLENKEKIRYITDKIIKMSGRNINVILNDYSGRREHYLLEKVKDSANKGDVIFEFIDEHIDKDKLSGIYNARRDIFIIADRFNRLKGALTINLNDCYLRDDMSNHGHSPAQYVRMAEYFLCKTNHI